MEIAGKVSARAANALRRARLGGHLIKPIEECTDQELLLIRGIGRQTLAEIRQASGGNSPLGRCVLGDSRRDKVIRLRGSGLTYAEIGNRLGISKERVRQILKGRPASQKLAIDSNIMLTAADVARVLGIHTNTVRRWSAKGILKSYRIGPRRDRRFKREDIEGFLKGEESAARHPSWEVQEISGNGVCNTAEREPTR
jgi:excisionase family DNA binding protein